MSKQSTVTEPPNVHTNRESANGIITGCGKGIGLACLQEFLENSPKTAIALGITRSKTKELEELKAKYLKRIIVKYHDINNHAMVNKALEEFAREHGMPGFAICNAGIRSRISIKDATVQKYRDVLEANTIAQINIVKTLATLKKNSEGRLNILVISSIVGQRGFANLSTYGVSKAAVEGFVKSAALELAGDNICINSLNPGFTESSYAEDFKNNSPGLHQWTIDQTPLGRWGSCEEVAKMAMFLVSPANTYMTGTVVYCDGGWTSK